MQSLRQKEKIKYSELHLQWLYVRCHAWLTFTSPVCDCCLSTSNITYDLNLLYATFCRESAKCVWLVSPSPLSLASYHCTCHSSWWAVNLETASGRRWRELTCVKLRQASQKQTVNTSAVREVQGLLNVSQVYLAKGIPLFLSNITVALTPV